MSKLLNLIKWGATLGKDEQNFLGAVWVPAFLKRVPERSRRKWALRILDLSPHYFLFPDDPKYAGLSKDEYLESISDEARISREKIRDAFLLERLRGVATVIDWGCGPGFMAKAVSPHVGKVFAVDISEGALACAKIINGAENIEYVLGDAAGLSSIPDDSADAVISFHVFQHLSDQIARTVLSNIHSKLKRGGKLTAHVQAPTETWRSEEDWRSDASLKGKVKLKYGLHCFGRTTDEYSEMFRAAGFGKPVFEEMRDLMPETDEDLDGQMIATAVKE